MSRARAAWPGEVAAAVAVQEELARLTPPLWTPDPGPPAVAAVAVAGPSRPGEGPIRAAAALLRGEEVVAAHVVQGLAAAPYEPTLLALREGPLLAAAVQGLTGHPDVLLVAAAGRDHPRRAGLALHLGAVLGLPTVGVTDRPLVAVGAQPGPHPGASAPLLLRGEEVARWVRTAPGARPVVAHAAWRTSAATAATVVLTTTRGARTPEPLRIARRLAREARREPARRREAS